MNLAFDVPICQTSFGQIAHNLLYEAYQRGGNPHVFVRGGTARMAPFKRDDEFNNWLQNRVNESIKSYDREMPCYKLWHVNGLLESYSQKNWAATFHETDQLTEAEVNTLRQQKGVFVSSKYTQSVFAAAGLNNVHYCPLAFDSRHFGKIAEKQYYTDDIIAFGLRGKMEKRKNTLRILKLWCDKYGNNKKYRLDCSIFNQFMQPEQQEAMIKATLGGKLPWNVNMLKMIESNEVYNDALNATDIDLTGMSGCEGFNLPLFQSLCIGKHAVVLNAHVHKDFCDAENSVLVEPKTEMVPADDGMFFQPGQLFNQGNWFDFEDEAFIAGMEEAEKRAKTPNPAGEDLSARFTYKGMMDNILEIINTTH